MSDIFLLFLVIFGSVVALFMIGALFRCNNNNNSNNNTNNNTNNN